MASRTVKKFEVIPRICYMGFTLIEVLSAMAIVVVLVLFLGRVFAESSTAWSLASKRTEVNNIGRAIAEIMARDIAGALADDVIRFQLNSDVDRTFATTTQGFLSDELRFVALDNTPVGTQRGVSEYVYYVGRLGDTGADRFRYILRRSRIVNRNPGQNQQMSAYVYPGNPNSEFSGIGWVNKGRGGDLIAENVRALEIWAYAYDFENPRFDTFDFDTMAARPPANRSWGPPLWVDFYFELLGESDAIRAADLANTLGPTHLTTQSFLEQRSIRFAARAHPLNASGYNRLNEYYPFYEPYNEEYDWYPYIDKP